MTMPPIPPTSPESIEPRFAAMIDAFLDGSLSESDALTFAQRLQSDAAHRTELALQQKIDSRLRRVAGVPAEMPALPSIAPASRFLLDSTGYSTVARPSAPSPIPTVAATTSGGRVPRRWLWSLSAAALLMLTAIGGYVVLHQPGMPLAKDRSLIAANYYFKQQVGDGLKPEVVCTSPEEFKRFTKERFGVALTIQTPPDLELVGWSYTSNILGPYATTLLARRNNQPVIVVIDYKNNDREVYVDPACTGGEGRFFRRKLDRLVMYEISGLGQEAVMPLMSVAD